jgi:hypothetical protein
VLRIDARLAEALHEVLAVLDRDREDDGALAGTVDVPLLDDVPGELAAGHHQLEAVLVVVGADLLHLVELRDVVREPGERNEVALADQLARRRRDDRVLEQLAQALVIEAPRRCGEPDDGRARVVLQDG